MRQLCVASAGSKGRAGATARSSASSASRSGSRNVSAFAVGRMPRGPGSSSGSPNTSRNFARCTLTDGCEKFSRSAARVTLCSASSTSSVTSRLRSNLLRLTNVIPDMLGIHFQYTSATPIVVAFSQQGIVMNVLIVYAHPEPKSLNGSLKDFAVQHLERAGHTVQVSDLYAMNWKASLDANDTVERHGSERFFPSLE